MKMISKRVADVASAIEIDDVKFLRFSAEHNPERCRDKMLLEFGVKTQAIPEAKKSLLKVHVDFQLKAKTDEIPPLEGVLVTVRLELQYKCPEIGRFDRSDLDAFAKYNGVFNAWPYLRQFVQDCVARMGLPSLIIPVFRPFAARRKKRPGQRKQELQKTTQS